MKKKRTEFTVQWKRCIETPMSMSIGTTQPFTRTKKVRVHSWWLRWLLRSTPLKGCIERDRFGDDIVVQYKQRKNTVYLVSIEWVDKLLARKRIDGEEQDGS